MDPVPGYALASWERGYGDFGLQPDLETLRRIPWHEATVARPLRRAVARRLAGRSVAAAGAEGAARAGEGRWATTPRSAPSSSSSSSARPTRRRTRSSYRDLTPSVPYILDYHILGAGYDEPFMRAIRTAMKAAGMKVESSKGEAWPGQHEINFRYAMGAKAADDHVIYKTGAKELAHQCGMSLTFMAKPDHTWVGSSCHIHSSLWRDGESAFAGETDVFKHYLAGQIALASELAIFFAPTINSYKRFAAGKLGADDARLGLRQPHVRLPHRRARQGAAARRRAFPVPTRIRTSRSPRCSPPGLYGIEQKLELGPAFEGNAYESDVERFPGTLRDAIARLESGTVARHAARRRGRRPLPELRAHRAAALRRGRDDLRARADVRAWLSRSSASRRTSSPRPGATGSSTRR